MKALNRYQLFLQFVKVSFWLSVLFLVILAEEVAGFDLLHSALPLTTRRLVGVALVINLLLAIFLVVARFMRDEFAEGIWQKTAQQFVYCLVLAPQVITVLLLTLEDRIRESVRDDWISPELLDHLHKYPNPVWHLIGGAGWALIFVGLAAPALFVCLYNWNIWRAER